MNRIVILDGPQAAGKSTIAKAIFFFRTVKDDIFRRIFSDGGDMLHLDVQFYLRQKFMQTFGLHYHIEQDMVASYTYADGVEIALRFHNGENPVLAVELSDKILSWLLEYEERPKGGSTDSTRIQEELNLLFQDVSETVYIPAGRSMLSLLTHQLNYILAVLDENQRSMIDYCTRNYIEKILKIKPFFEGGATNILQHDFDNTKPERRILAGKLMGCMEKILHGRYEYSKGNELLSMHVHGEERKIKINFASSGQQEVLWILNVIFYYIMAQRQSCFIIEEPEAHLYPDAQKDIAEYIALALNGKNECVITTHSPYILGSFNNLLDVERVRRNGMDISMLLKEYGLIDAQLLHREGFDAYFVHDGIVEDAIDEETGLIRNELIDGASDAINRFADKLFDLESEHDE